MLNPWIDFWTLVLCIIYACVLAPIVLTYWRRRDKESLGGVLGALVAMAPIFGWLYIRFTWYG